MAAVATAEQQSHARRSEKAGQAALLCVPAASAFVTAHGSLEGLFDLAVRPEFRRRGLGQRVMAAAADWARRQGANSAYSQVTCANRASLTLNAGLGLMERYRDVYLLKD